MSRSIGPTLFARPTLEVAPLLIGTILEVNGCSARIVEVEAYTNDPASHAFRRTARSSIMFDTFGHVYVYLIYGRNFCLNFTTDKAQEGAVLIRAGEPRDGISLMQKRRGVDDIRRLCSGPGNLCKSLGIDLRYNGTLISEKIRLYRGKAGVIATSPRIGITRATDLHWRFYEAGHPCVSGRTKPRIES
jgi:DNA-3-methyladenine glycosylase